MPFDIPIAEEIWTAKYRFAPHDGEGDDSFAATAARVAAALAEAESPGLRPEWQSRFHDAIGVVTVLASGIFLLCVMIIRVDERRRDMGVLRLIGVGRGTVFRAIVLETLAIALLGSGVGALLGMVVAGAVNAYYARLYDTTLRFALVTPRIGLTAAGLGLLLGAAAGALAAWRLTRGSPQRLGER